MNEFVKPASPTAALGSGLLKTLPPEDLQTILSAGVVRTFLLDEVVCPAGAWLNHVFFVEHGVASIVKVEGSGRRTEIGLIGPEGFTGVGLLLDDGMLPYEICSQSEELKTLMISAALLKEMVQHSPAARRILHAALFAQMVQIAENLVSATRQTVVPRLARWLLMYRDRLHSDRMAITHAHMAVIIGAQRTKVTEALHALEGAGAIIASRGVVLITDAVVLQSIADLGFEASVRHPGVPDSDFNGPRMGSSPS